MSRCLRNSYLIPYHSPYPIGQFVAFLPAVSGQINGCFVIYSGSQTCISVSKHSTKMI